MVEDGKGEKRRKEGVGKMRGWVCDGEGGKRGEKEGGGNEGMGV